MAGGAAAVLSALLVWAGTTELEAGANVDVRAGQSPVVEANTAGEGVLTERSRSQVLVAATPLLGVRLTGERSELRALSATRMLWRPVPYADQRPIFLETLEVAHNARPSPRSRWQLNLLSTYGEEDYTSLLRQFGANQPELPAALSMFAVSALGDGSWRASRRTTLFLFASGAYRQSLDDQPSAGSGTPGTLALPTQTLVVLTPAGRYALDRRTSLEVRTGIGDIDIQGIRRDSSASGRVNILTLQPQVGLIRDLTRTQQLRLFGGLTYAVVLSSPDDSRDWRTLTPLFRGDLSSVLWRAPASSVRSLLGFEAAWQADPMLGLAVWRTTAFANLDAQLGPGWGAAVRASFTTDLNSPVWVNDRPLDETIVQVEVPFRYRWSSQLVVEMGGRYSERAPNLFADEFAWRSRELWAFVTLTGTTHRTRIRPGPTARPTGSPTPGTPPPDPTTSTNSRS